MEEKVSRYGEYLRIHRISRLEHPIRSGPPTWGFGEGLTTPHITKKYFLQNVTQDILVGKPEGIRPLGRPRRRGEDNIRMDLRETVWKVVDWIHLTQDRGQWRALVNIAMKLRIPYMAGNFFARCVIISFSGKALLHAVS
jgi:hypothetical protein